MPEDTGEQNFTVWVESRGNGLDRLQVFGQVNGNDLLERFCFLWPARLLWHLVLLSLTTHHTLGEDHWAEMECVTP